MNNGRIRHATEAFVNNLIDSVKKLIADNTDKITQEINERTNADTTLTQQINVLEDGKVDKITFNRDVNIDTFYKEGVHRIFNAVGKLPLDIPQGNNDIMLTCYTLSDGFSFIRKTLLDVRSNKMYLYSKRGDIAYDWEEIATTSSSSLMTVRDVTTLNNDLNNGYINGIYHMVNVQEFSNKPPTLENVGNLIVMGGTTNNSLSKVQYFIPFNNTGVYIRTRGYGLTEWFEWQKISTTVKTDITPNTGWVAGSACGSTCVINGNMVTYNAILIGDGTNIFPVKLPIPRMANGNAYWFAGSAMSNEGIPKYLVLQPDGWLSFQMGYEPNKLYAINLTYPI